MKRGRRAIALLPLASGASGCAGNLSTLDPAGPAAGATALLWWVMLAGAAAIMALVLALVALAFAKPGIGRSVDPGRWLVWGGLVFPGIVLSALLVFALGLGERLLPHPNERTYTVEAVPVQWAWTFRYPGGGETAGILHLPVGRPIDVRVVGTDVIHSFWVPRLGGKVDAIPGHVNVLRLQADRPGRYGGVCSEFCGVGHGAMGFTVLAHAQADFDAALDAAAARPETPAADGAR